eukprot:4735793-Amphidinium_carterae.1
MQELIPEFYNADGTARYVYIDTGTESNSTWAFYAKSPCASRWSLMEHQANEDNNEGDHINLKRTKTGTGTSSSSVSITARANTMTSTI